MPTCAICLDSPADPAALPCGHVFCHRCIIQVVRKVTPYTHRHFCPTCRQAYTIAQVDPTLVPHHLQPHITPSIRKLHLEYSIPIATAASTAAECDRLRAEVASLRACCVMWRKRAAVHASASLGLVGLARVARDSAWKMKSERDELEARYNALKKTFHQTQTLATLPPQDETKPLICENISDTPRGMTPELSRTDSPPSSRRPSPSLSVDSFCSDCSECRLVQKRKGEDLNVSPLKRTRSDTSPLPQFARMIIEESVDKKLTDCTPSSPTKSRA